MQFATSNFNPSQDKQIAFKIFELGLKRFGHEPDYLLAYIDYMSHLNGKNRTSLQHA